MVSTEKPSPQSPEDTMQNTAQDSSMASTLIPCLTSETADFEALSWAVLDHVSPITR